MPRIHPTAHKYHYPNFQHDLSDPAVLESLAPRSDPYWMLLANGRALGLFRWKGSYWRARIKLQSGAYEKTTLGALDTNGRIGDRPLLTFEEAREAAFDWFSGFDGVAIDPQPPSLRQLAIPEPPGGDTYTVGHAIADHLRWMRDAGNDIRRYITIANSKLLPVFGDIPLSDLRAETIQAWMLRESRRPARNATMLSQGVDPAEQRRRRKRTVNHDLTVLRAALKHAFLNRKIGSDAEWRRVPVFRHTSAPVFCQMTDGDISALLETARPDEAALFRIALTTGLRLTELVSLRRADAILDTGKLKIEQPKSGYPRVHVLSAEALRVFSGLTLPPRQQDQLLRRQDGRPWTLVSARYAVMRASRQAGIRSASFRAFRHTYASRLVEAGVPIRIVADQLGHISSATAELFYAHLTEDARDRIVRTLVPDLLPETARHASGENS